MGVFLWVAVAPIENAKRITEASVAPGLGNPKKQVLVFRLSVVPKEKSPFSQSANACFSAFCCLALSYLSNVKLVWLVELEFPLAHRPSSNAPRGRWHAWGSTGGQDQQGGWVGQKKVLSVRRVFAGVASVTESGPVPVSVL